ncbi:hypothetical protein Syun_029565 [Stephania yunnanensis]|uniref:Uncharacterized protein n=1 Tax=Stephania yunnanensis TaxID=152371 RepID=A0AAP0E5V3_9MAGN
MGALIRISRLIFFICSLMSSMTQWSVGWLVLRIFFFLLMAGSDRSMMQLLKQLECHFGLADGEQGHGQLAEKGQWGWEDDRDVEAVHERLYRQAGPSGRRMQSGS